MAAVGQEVPFDFKDLRLVRYGFDVSIADPAKAALVEHFNNSLKGSSTVDKVLFGHLSVSSDSGGSEILPAILDEMRGIRESQETLYNAVHYLIRQDERRREDEKEARNTAMFSQLISAAINNPEGVEKLAALGAQQEKAVEPAQSRQVKCQASSRT